MRAEIEPSHAEAETARDEPGAPPPPRSWYRIAGLVFVLMFFGITETRNGFMIQYFPPFTRVSPGEANLWLAATFLLLPGACLLGLGYSGVVGVLVGRAAAALSGLSRREVILAAVALFAIGVAASRVGGAVVLRDYAITDDEYAAQFGGRVLASGQVKIATPEFADAIPNLFFWDREGTMTSGDWPGVQFVWALEELTGETRLVWAALASLAVLGAAAAVSRRLDVAWGAVAAAFLFLSPMAFALTITTHAHVASRAFVGLAYWALAVAWGGRRARPWVLFGLCVGATFFCRPPEAVFLFLPVGIAVTVSAVRRRAGGSLAFAAALAGAALPVAAFFLHAYLVTGTLLPPRLIPGGMVTSPWPESTLWYRFGANTSFNTMLLFVWFLGPAGVALAIAGVGRDGFTKLVGGTLVSFLALGLLHTDTGIHTVGPIHYSESVVPLAILAAFGLQRLVSASRELWRHEMAAVAALAVVLVAGTCNFVNLLAMYDQATVQEAVYSRIESQVPRDRRSVVLAPHFGGIWKSFTSLDATGSWVFVWRRPRPAFDDEVLILNDVPKLEETLRAHFPDRAFYRVRLSNEAPHVHLDPLDAAPAER
jgi:hypothetical protein